MITHIKMIYWVIDVVERNLEEAEKYVTKASGLRIQYRSAADWCAEMARKHLEFNIKGDAMLDQLCRELHDAGGGSELYQAMKAAVHERRERIAERTADIKMTLDKMDK